MNKKMIASGALAMIVASTSATAQVVFSSDMDSGAAWTVNAPADTANTFGFDFTAAPYGIPPSPGGSTTGLQMKANIMNGTPATVIATPTGVSVTGSYVVEFDFWINANGPFPAGGTGSTEFCGGGVGYDGFAQGLNGASLVISGEGGASRDWRMYKDADEQFLASGQYDVDDNNNFGADLTAAFPGQMAPAAQVTMFPSQSGTTLDGVGGFAWHHMVISANSVAGTVNFTVDGVSIGTIDANIGNSVETSGNLSVIYHDPFASVSDNSEMSFGIIDNYVVTLAAQNYCISLPTSSGSAAVMFSAGSTSVATADLGLIATGLPSGVSGLFYFGTSQLAAPFGDGFRCVGGTVQRLPISMADANGVLTQTDVFGQPMPNVQIVPGTFNFQAWFRDVAAGMSGFNLSDGLSIVFVP